MFHPGSNASKEKGIKFIIEGINEALSKPRHESNGTKKTCPQGNWVEATSKSLKILDGVIDKERFGFA